MLPPTSSGWAARAAVSRTNMIGRSSNPQDVTITFARDVLKQPTAQMRRKRCEG